MEEKMLLQPIIKGKSHFNSHLCLHSLLFLLNAASKVEVGTSSLCIQFCVNYFQIIKGILFYKDWLTFCLVCETQNKCLTRF